ncbi:MAG: ABC transporter ATP-binding protein [Sulfurospirillum sp.]|nr:ABC transporter ATP-binding protein [Sulfurospirillum sp.]
MGEEIYGIRNILKTYGHKPVLDIYELSIQKGEILGIVGSNGCGKSTLLRHLAFLEMPHSGSIKYKNFAHTDIPLHVRREIGILLPEPYLLKRSVKDNLLFGLHVRGEKNVPTKDIEEALKLVGLIPKKFLNRQWHELSSGETQRVALASRLILKPQTLLLDEPTNSLDFSGIPQFSDALMHANQEWGTTIIIASHDLLWLSSITTRQIGLHFGRIMDFSTSNLVLGKWQEDGKNKSFDFGNNQKITIPASWRVGEKRGVAIDPRKICISSSAPLHFEDTKIYLQGTVSGISRLEKTDEISIKIAIGSQTLEAITNQENFEKSAVSFLNSVYINFTKESLQNKAR